MVGKGASLGGLGGSSELPESLLGVGLELRGRGGSRVEWGGLRCWSVAERYHEAPQAFDLLSVCFLNHVMLSNKLQKLPLELLALCL